MFEWMFKPKPASQGQPEPAASATKSPQPKAKSRTNEPSEADRATLELLQAAETYPILVLMLPHLVGKLKQRLSEIERELGAITGQLQQLHNRRNDILAASTGNSGGGSQIMPGPTATAASQIKPATITVVDTKPKQAEGVAA